MWGTIRVTDHHPTANRQLIQRQASQSNNARVARTKRREQQDFLRHHAIHPRKRNFVPAHSNDNADSACLQSLFIGKTGPDGFSLEIGSWQSPCICEMSATGVFRLGRCRATSDRTGKTTVGRVDLTDDGTVVHGAGVLCLPTRRERGGESMAVASTAVASTAVASTAFESTVVASTAVAVVASAVLLRFAGGRSATGAAADRAAGALPPRMSSRLGSILLLPPPLPNLRRVHTGHRTCRYPSHHINGEEV